MPSAATGAGASGKPTRKPRRTHPTANRYPSPSANTSANLLANVCASPGHRADT
jgi:hypothetical protein